MGHTSRFHATRRAGLHLTVLLALMIATGGYSPPLSADDGCEQDEPVACLILPDAAAAGAACRPLPQLARPPALDEAVPAARLGLACLPVAIFDAINHANVLYVRAVRTLDAEILTAAWDGEARTAIDAQITMLRDRGRFASAYLLSIEPTALDFAGAIATVHTREHWLEQEHDALTGALLAEDDRWIERVYSLKLRGERWFVVERT